MAIQPALLAAVQVHPAGAITVTLPRPPVPGTMAVIGEMVAQPRVTLTRVPETAVSFPSLMTALLHHLAPACHTIVVWCRREVAGSVRDMAAVTTEGPKVIVCVNPGVLFCPPFRLRDSLALVSGILGKS